MSHFHESPLDIMRTHGSTQQLCNCVCNNTGTSGRWQSAEIQTARQPEPIQDINISQKTASFTVEPRDDELQRR